MSLAVLTRQLLLEGRIVLTGPVFENLEDDRETAMMLEEVFVAHRQSVAGEPISFDPGIALVASKFVARAAWYLVSMAEKEAEPEKQLCLPTPRTASEHLSGDLLLRFVPYLYKRAQHLNPNDVLTQRVAGVLRRWPLSGVLADLCDEPLGELDFGGHRGLMLLYAERLAANFKPGWLPRGRGMAYVELVWSELGRDMTVLKPAREKSERPVHDRKQGS